MIDGLLIDGPAGCCRGYIMGLMRDVLMKNWQTVFKTLYITFLIREHMFTTV